MYALYRLDSQRLADGLTTAVTAYHARHGAAPSVALVHPSRLAAVQPVLPFARTRQPGDPIPQPGDLLLGGNSPSSPEFPPFPRFPLAES